jgi:hypothetical protein
VTRARDQVVPRDTSHWTLRLSAPPRTRKWSRDGTSREHAATILAGLCSPRTWGDPRAAIAVTSVSRHLHLGGATLPSSTSAFPLSPHRAIPAKRQPAGPDGYEPQVVGRARCVCRGHHRAVSAE